MYFGSPDAGHDEETAYWIGESMGSLVYYTIAKDNAEAFYDPAEGQELGPVPWKVITDLVNE